MFTKKSHPVNAPLWLKEAVRNFHDETQCVFLAAVFVQLGWPTSRDPLKSKTMTLQERKWTVIKSDGARACIVQTYHQITRDSVEPGYKGLWTRQVLEEVMVPTWLSIFTSIQSHVEAILLEQSLLKRNGFSHHKRLGREMTQDSS